MKEIEFNPLFIEIALKLREVHELIGKAGLDTNTTIVNICDNHVSFRCSEYEDEKLTENFAAVVLYADNDIAYISPGDLTEDIKWAKLTTDRKVIA